MGLICKRNTLSDYLNWKKKNYKISIDHTKYSIEIHFKKMTDIYQVVVIRNKKGKEPTSNSYSIVGYRNYTTIDFTTQFDTNTDNF